MPGASLTRSVRAATWQRKAEGRGEDAEEAEVVLRDPDGVEAEFLGVDALVEGIEDEFVGVLAFVAVAWGIVGEGEVAQLHGVHLLFLGDHGTKWQSDPSDFVVRSDPKFLPSRMRLETSV